MKSSTFTAFLSAAVGCILGLCLPAAAAAADSAADLDYMAILRWLNIMALMLGIGAVFAISKKPDPLIRPSGMGGWLAFFSGGLLSGSVIDIFLLLQAYRQQIDLYPSLRFGLILDACITIGFSLAAIYGVLLICRFHRSAVSYIKIFLAASFLFALAAPVISLLCLNLVAPNNLLTLDIIKESYNPLSFIDIVKKAIRLLIWYPYFLYSKRVKNTWFPFTLQHSSEASEIFNGVTEEDADTVEKRERFAPSPFNSNR